MTVVANQRPRISSADGASRRVAQSPAFVELEPDRLWADRDWVDHLAAVGLTSLRAVMDGHCGVRMRRVADRENWRLAVPTGEGTTTVYLKKHRSRSLWSRWRAWCGARPRNSPGRIEAENSVRMAECGIPAVRPVAFGEALAGNGLVESFVMTEDLRGYSPLDDFLQARFSGMADEGGKDRRSLIAAVARVARRFHDAGFNHRDFYCCHFFVRESAPGQFDVCLIDLQRVQRRQRLRRRWIVKDLAQLAYSAPRRIVRSVDAMLLFKQYLGVDKLSSNDKRFWRRLRARVQGMERRTGIRP